MSFSLGFQYWTILPESREIWVRLGSDWRLHAGWFSPQPLWATLALVGCHCTMPINPLATFSCWLVSIFPYPPSILHPNLPWEAALYAPYSIAPLLTGFGWVWRESGVAREWRLGGERDWGVYILCCRSAPSQFWQRQFSSMTTAPVRKPSPVALALLVLETPLSPLVFSGLGVIIVSAVDNP